MHVLAVAAATLLFTAQTEAPPPPPLPESSDRLEEEAPPPPPIDEPGEASTPAPPPLDAPPPGATAKKSPAAAPAGDPGGMSPFMVFLTQWAVGCGTTCVLFVIPCGVSLIPFVGGVLSFLLNSAMCLIAGPIVGLVETLVGDMFGQQRGALLWSILGGYAGWVGGAIVGGIGGAIGAVLTAVIGGSALAGIFTLLQQSGGNPIVFLGALLATYAGVIIVAVVTALVVLAAIVAGTALGPAIAYMFTAQDKRAGDTKFRFPGFIEPNHPEGTEASIQLPDLSGPRKAMAY